MIKSRRSDSLLMIDLLTTWTHSSICYDLIWSNSALWPNALLTDRILYWMIKFLTEWSVSLLIIKLLINAPIPYYTIEFVTEGFNSLSNEQRPHWMINSSLMVNLRTKLSNPVLNYQILYQLLNSWRMCYFYRMI